MNTVLYNTILSKIPAENRENELKKLTDNYPFFALPRFLLLKKTTYKADVFLDRSKKACLLFSPYLLTRENENTDDETGTSAIEPAEKKAPENELKEKGIAVSKAVEEENIEENTPSPEKEDTNIHISKDKISVPQIVTENRKLQQVPSSPMIFVPLHTSDYFASQGIKISYNPNPTDKLGKQLKSFTGWLQTMKHVHPAKVNLATAQHDVKVEALAEKSNIEDEVLTEAMAEAYLHQGKTGKAIETYRKLSLLNPTKSTYFAAKINELQYKK